MTHNEMKLLETSLLANVSGGKRNSLLCGLCDISIPCALDY
ncbi:hypothetical protein WNY63_21280 [Pseudoalteromonas neustonica]|uniref:Bacteriocin n=1 Tax=Pseudoalteromonas neustonica TaxID=1840331 RepID=A0ABU9U893_9GAMM